MSGSGEPGTDLDTIRKAVDELFIFRDHFFEKYGLDKAVDKAEDTQNEMRKVLVLFENLQENAASKAEVLMLKGKTQNVGADFSEEAKENLSRAVKLDPKLVEGWIQLGECYWKNQDVDSAKNCFVCALQHAPSNKIALRNLSMVLRQVGASQEERLTNIEDSVSKAKEAVQKDLSDGTSWFILGNAYLSLFFASSQSTKILKQCMSAYQRAEQDAVAKSNPDLHYNRATAYKYQEEYELALRGFQQAGALDPTWSGPKDKELLLLQYLERVSELTAAKGKVKSKKLQNLTNSINEKELGPYAGGSYTSPRQKTIKLELCSLNNLQPGPNDEKVVQGKVVCSLAAEEPVPFTFCMIDKESTCVCVTVYNIAQGYGCLIGDSVAIPEPYLQNVDFQYKDKHVMFKSIRVGSPLVLVVNKKKLGLDKQAPSVLGVDTMSE